MKKKLYIFTLYSSLGASSNYRILQFIDRLEEIYEVKVFTFWNDVYLRKLIHHKKKYFIHIFFLYLINLLKRIVQLEIYGASADIVFFQKAVIPKCSYDPIKKLHSKNIKIIFDIDDAVYLLKKDKTDKLIKNVDTVICGNMEIAEHYHELNNKIGIIPTIDCNKKYKIYSEYTFGKKNIGWIGSSSTIDNLNIIVDSFNKIHKEFPEINFILISDSPHNYDKRINGCTFIKWTKENYVEAMKDISIGIMPLYDNKINRGKCGFKLIQYLSLGKPVIASGVGVNVEIVGNCGIIANTSMEWEEAFRKLLTDKLFYDRCVNAISTEFNQKYDYNSVANKIIEIIGD